MKHRIYIVALALFLFAVSVPAQTATAYKLDAAQQNLRKDIEYLASDKLEGRRTGEQGATLAAGYITDIFAKLKLQPGVRSDKGKLSYQQPFPYVSEVEMAGAGNEFRYAFDSAPCSQDSHIDTSVEVRPVGFSPNGKVERVPVIFAGFGIYAPDLDFNDYTSVDAKGKVVLIFDGTPDGDNPHSRFSRFDVRTKALIAKERGAVGLIVISAEENFDDEKLTRLKYDQTLGEAALPTFVASKNVAIDMLCSDAEGLQYIKKTAAGRKANDESWAIPSAIPVVTFGVNLTKKRADAYNVIGILPGTDPVLKNEAIVIGAHYDHLGHGGQGSLDVNSTAIHHGADDNASGTAAILELAREFAREKKNKRTLIFIAFSGEEEGLIGSKYYVNNPVLPLDKTIAMINLDMVGRIKENKLSVGGIGTAGEWKREIEGFNTQFAELLTTDLKNKKYDDLTPGKGPRFALQLNEDGFGPSDHSSFYGKKIPVLFFFTGTHEDYHKPSDTADKINYPGLQRVVHFVRDIIVNVDETDKRPTYTVAKSSGIGGGRSGFNISLGTVPSYVDSTDGLVLDGVRDNSPAAKAGLKPGDKVIKLAGKDVRNVMDYTYILGEMKAGEEYEVVVIRGGERVTMTIIPVRR